MRAPSPRFATRVFHRWLRALRRVDRRPRPGVLPVGTAALLAVLAACGGAAPARAVSGSSESTKVASALTPAAAMRGKSTPTDAPDAPVADSARHPAADLPASCAGARDDGLCLPPPAFVDRLCEKPRPNSALALFAAASPFTRLYLRGRVDELSFDEEVLALRFHGRQKGAMVVGSGKGTYDLLRWDGTCATGLEAEVLTRMRPARPRTARLHWHRIESRIQDALVVSSDAVKRAHAKRGKECKGAMSGDVSAACEKADEALVTAVVEYVRGGGELPPVDDEMR